MIERHLSIGVDSESSESVARAGGVSHSLDWWRLIGNAASFQQELFVLRRQERSSFLGASGRDFSTQGAFKRARSRQVSRRRRRCCRSHHFSALPDLPRGCARGSESPAARGPFFEITPGYYGLLRISTNRRKFLRSTRHCSYDEIVAKNIAPRDRWRRIPSFSTAIAAESWVRSGRWRQVRRPCQRRGRARRLSALAGVPGGAGSGAQNHRWERRDFFKISPRESNIVQRHSTSKNMRRSN